MSPVEFNTGSIGIAALFTSVGAKPEEIDEALEILTMFPNPNTYEAIVQQATAALTQLRGVNRAGSAINGNVVLPVPPDVWDSKV